MMAMKHGVGLGVLKKAGFRICGCSIGIYNCPDAINSQKFANFLPPLELRWPPGGTIHGSHSRRTLPSPYP